MKKNVAWLDVGLRVLCCALLFGVGYQLIMGSTFGFRMRDDYPVTTFALALAGGLSIIPLVAWRKFLRAFLVSAFALTSIGAYWWTRLPWDRFLTNSQFPTSRPPGALDYLLVMAPALIAAFYTVASRASVMRADWLRRGAERDEATRAAGASFLAGAAALIVCLGLTFALVALLMSGALLTGLPQLRGVPAIAAAGALVALVVLLTRRRVPAREAKAHHAPHPRPRAAQPEGGAAPQKSKRSWFRRAPAS